MRHLLAATALACIVALPVNAKTRPIACALVTGGGASGVVDKPCAERLGGRSDQLWRLHRRAVRHAQRRHYGGHGRVHHRAYARRGSMSGSPRLAESGRIVAHPAGCPHIAFCGCGAAIEIFGKPIRSLWLAANWFRFPRAEPAPGMAAVRQHHVMVIREVLSGNRALVYDANSGGHLTRVHVRSLSGYKIVNPRAS